MASFALLKKGNVIETNKKVFVAVLAGIIIVGPEAMELACGRKEAHEFYRPVNCENSAKSLRAPFRESCGTLVDRSFPPHNHANNEGDAGNRPTEILFSASTASPRTLPVSMIGLR